MNNSLWKKGALMAAGIFLSHMAFTSPALSPSAQAQPDLNNAPKAENPAGRNRPNRPNRPERNQNRQEGQRNPEDGIRRMMQQAGVADETTQNTVLEYMKNDMQARRPLREQGQKVFRALQGGAVTDDQLAALITDYRAAQQAEKTRREQAQAELDAKIQFSKNPRLEAMLLLTGLIGDGGLVVMPNGMGGRGGPGENRRGQGGGAGGGNAANREERQKRMLERFDKNKDGKLDAAEEEAMREQARQRREQRGNRGQNAPAAPANAMPEEA